MKAGLVRIASRSLLALAVVGLSACNDDPLDFNVKTATRIATNPSVMVLNSGGVQRLTVNTLNEGFEPTFDVPTLTEGAGCTAPVSGDVAVKELPPATGGGSSIDAPIDSVLATGAEPPSKYDVTGVAIGETCLVGAFGGLSEEIPVTVVPFALGLTGPDTIVDGDFTVQTYLIVAFAADSSIDLSFDPTASFVTVATSDTLIAKVVAVDQLSASVVRGPLGGTTTLTITSDQNGVIRTTSLDIFVEKPIPQVANITPASGGPGDTVTIDGAQLSIKNLNGVETSVSVNGLFLANVISESATQLVVVMPSFGAAGSNFPVVVDVDGAQIAGGTWDQTTAYSGVGCGPACESPASPAPVSVPFDFAGDMSAGETDNFFLFSVSRDMDIAMTLGWANAATDVDLLVVDGAFTAYVCTDGATGANPEASACHTEDVGAYMFWVNVYAGPDPGAYTASAQVSGFR